MNETFLQRSVMVQVDARNAESLRMAAAILRCRSTRPNGLAMRVLCRILTNQADKIAGESE